MLHTPKDKDIDPFHFNGDDISLEQLAHALACQNRYYGHTSFPISIAQHAVAVSKIASSCAMQGLHHDDSEAIIGDINKYLKETNLFAEYRLLEDIIQIEFFKRFKCKLEMDPSVKIADQLACRCEMALGFNRYYDGFSVGYSPPSTQELDFFMDVTDFKIDISWREAQQLYLTQHERLVLVEAYK